MKNDGNGVICHGRSDAFRAFRDFRSRRPNAQHAKLLCVKFASQGFQHLDQILRRENLW